MPDSRCLSLCSQSQRRPSRASGFDEGEHIADHQSSQLPPVGRARLHKIRFEMKHAPITIAPGVGYAAWTFGGSVPGPMLRVRQGDTVDLTLVNRANIPHSMDFHAAEIAPARITSTSGRATRCTTGLSPGCPVRSCITVAPRR